MTKNPFTGETSTVETSLTEILSKHGFSNGRMICLSKSRYVDAHRDEKVYPYITYDDKNTNAFSRLKLKEKKN